MLELKCVHPNPRGDHVRIVVQQSRGVLRRLLPEDVGHRNQPLGRDRRRRCPVLRAALGAVRHFPFQGNADVPDHLVHPDGLHLAARPPGDSRLLQQQVRLAAQLQDPQLIDNTG